MHTERPSTTPTILQHNKTLETIRNASVKKVLGMIETLAEGENYASFWEAFGRVLKEGVIEDFANRERVAKLLRFASTHSDTDTQDVSLAAYVGRMKEGQDAIYYIVADGFSTARNSPHLEYFRKQGIEVLLMHEPIDEWLATHLSEFEGKPLKSVVHGDIKTDAESGQDQQQDEEVSPLLKRIKGALDARVEDVKRSQRLTSSPACLVSADAAMSANPERLLKAAGQDVPAAKRILELNVEHPMIKFMDDMQDEQQFANWASLLFEQSILAEGGKLDDPAGFVKRMNDVVLELAAARG